MEWYDQDPRFNPTLRSAPLERGWLINNSLPDPESQCVWAYMEDQQLASIPDLDTAEVMAETFPDTILFFAESVAHPNS